MTVRAFAQSIVETVRHPLLVLADDLRVWQANPAFYRTFGGTAAETEGRRVYELDGGRWDLPRLRGLLEELVPGGGDGEDLEFEHDFTPLGGKALLFAARRVRHDDGTPMVLLTIEDVTDVVRAREELHRLNRELENRVRERTAQLEAANRELEGFCYSVSHDLRAPLRALDGFSDELLRTYPGQVLDGPARHYLERIRAGTQRMGRLIDDLLQLSRLSRGEMKREVVDLSELATAFARELRQQDPSRQVTFAIEPGLSARGDPGLLRVALENLLSNAWKFTGRKSSATIRVGRGASAEGPAFFVRDDGAGFDQAHAGKLFGAFQRLHPEREFPGNGIGLATVQRVVRRHGGRVWAEGVPGRGATFYFTLPQGEAP